MSLSRHFFFALGRAWCLAREGCGTLAKTRSEESCDGKHAEGTKVRAVARLGCGVGAACIFTIRPVKEVKYNCSNMET